MLTEKQKLKFPTFARMLAEGTVFVRECDLMGVASDGTEVSFGAVWEGMAPKYLAAHESYFMAHATPDTW